ncbi:hypothetical protein A4A49_01780 [Nicotiana attenuata]|uniref:Uncharacterized protein n=1 Tax=Nicotiana attenuata TaxID=49451 RepID=A0A1J6IEG8_NICAT|nr:hypothetical protein A4A49_01780 [Nicotiana attenuata]
MSSSSSKATFTNSFSKFLKSSLFEAVSSVCFLRYSMILTTILLLMLGNGMMETRSSFTMVLIRSNCKTKDSSRILGQSLIQCRVLEKEKQKEKDSKSQEQEGQATKRHNKKDNTGGRHKDQSKVRAEKENTTHGVHDIQGKEATKESGESSKEKEVMNNTKEGQEGGNTGQWQVPNTTRNRQRKKLESKAVEQKENNGVEVQEQDHEEFQTIKHKTTTKRRNQKKKKMPKKKSIVLFKPAMVHRKSKLKECLVKKDN